MVEINDREIYITRSDTAVINLKVNDYNFVEGDVVYFSVKKNKYDTEYVIHKEITDFQGNIARTVLSSDDTNIPEGKYWYDYQCNLADGRIDTVVIPSRLIIGEQITVS